MKTGLIIAVIAILFFGTVGILLSEKSPSPEYGIMMIISPTNVAKWTSSGKPSINDNGTVTFKNKDSRTEITFSGVYIIEKIK